MKSDDEQLKSRGYIEDHELEPYQDFSKEELLELLHSKVAANRTIAAKTLIKFKDTDIVEAMIARLAVEKKLYTKIALSESIGCCGEEACPRLIEYLGKVGQNQYKQLPDKPFGKNNYPLPRDIISRTICKIGVPALKYLRNCLYTGSYEQILEAIDAVGFISFYGNDRSCLDDIITLMNKYEDDLLMLWKLIRALQAFPDEKVIDLLKKYMNSSIEQHRWEATKSIKQIENRLNLHPDGGKLSQ